jgi:hypothetical protein
MVGEVVMLVTGVTGGVMVVFSDVVDVVMFVTGVNGSSMVVSGSVIADVTMLVSKVKSPCYHIGEATKSMRPSKQTGIWIPTDAA